MRESLSKGSQRKAKVKSKKTGIAVSGNGTKSSVKISSNASRSVSASRTVKTKVARGKEVLKKAVKEIKSAVKTKKSVTGNKSKVGTSAKARVMKKAKQAKPVSRPKSTRSVKKAVSAAAKKKTAVKRARPAKAVAKKAAAPARARPKVAMKAKSPVRAKTPIKSSRSAKIRPRKKKGISLPLVVSPPVPPEPPRRQVSTGVLRAYEKAIRVFNRRQYADAKSMFENLSRKFPAEVEILACAQTYIHVCDQKLKHTASTPRNAEELYDRGVFALNIGDFSQARSFFEKALRLRPDEPHLLYSLAATHAQTGSDDQALDYLKRSIQIQPRFRVQALNDSDFSGLREDKRFLELIGLASPFDILESRFK